MIRLAGILFVVALATTMTGQGPANVRLSTRMLGDGTRSLLVEVLQPAGQSVEELRMELPRGADTAVPLTTPQGWKLERDGKSIRLLGPAERPPFRLRIALFETQELDRIKTRIRAGGKNLPEENLLFAKLPALTPAASTAGLLQMPAIVSPGETIELDVLDPIRTPAEGQWLIEGVPAKAVGPNRLRVRIPPEVMPGSSLRVSFFDVWGQAVLDALSSEDVVVTNTLAAAGAAPRITGCARYGFLGESLCICGNFPESSRGGVMLDGQLAAVISASQHVVHIRVPNAIAPGPHTIGGDPAAGFSGSEMFPMRAVSLRASIDASALLRGQSTTLRLAIDGAAEPVPIAVTNRTPHIISIPGGNYQEIEITNVFVERRVDARSPGTFQITTRVPEPPCPCSDQARTAVPSNASQQDPIFVPRRVLATIAAGTPAAMTATARTIAAANGLAVIEVTALPTAGVGLAVFEIVDGIGVAAKFQALGNDPNVIAAQPDFVYDTSQASAAPATSAAYGSQMIGADVAGSLVQGEGVRVAVIDAGVDTGHPRLQGRIAEYADVTGTGWTPDAHGTLVAGVIAAERGANGEPSGVAPKALLVAVKSCVPLSATLAMARCWSSSLARGIETALSKNVRVMNLSVGGPQDKLLTQMVATAASRGVAVVSAAGNDGPSGKPSYPAANDNVIAVTAVDAASRLYPQATRGSFIDLAAPGVDILSTGPGGRTQIFSGTSAATGFASGSVALLLQRSKLSLKDLTELLRSTAKDLGPAGADTQFGNGLLDVCRAVAQSLRQQISCH